VGLGAGGVFLEDMGVGLGAGGVFLCELEVSDWALMLEGDDACLAFFCGISAGRACPPYDVADLLQSNKPAARYLHTIWE
jgi:hypothetical protein